MVRELEEQPMNDEFATMLGEKLADCLPLKKHPDGKFVTAWGSKTAMGLARTVKRIMDENSRDTYLVKLRLIIGEFEKSAVHVIIASSSIEARKRAIECECHGTPESMTDNCDEAWDCGQMVYQVTDCDLIEGNDAEVIRRLL
jgi:hypothetical protein